MTAYSNAVLIARIFQYVLTMTDPLSTKAMSQNKTSHFFFSNTIIKWDISIYSISQEIYTRSGIAICETRFTLPQPANHSFINVNLLHNICTEISHTCCISCSWAYSTALDRRNYCLITKLLANKCLIPADTVDDQFNVQLKIRHTGNTWLC